MKKNGEFHGICTRGVAYLSKAPLAVNITVKLVQEELQLCHDNGPSSKLGGFSVANSSSKMKDDLQR
jgi:hypothetical protein